MDIGFPDNIIWLQILLVSIPMEFALRRKNILRSVNCLEKKGRFLKGFSMDIGFLQKVLLL